MKDLNPTDGDTKLTTSQRSPELQKRLDEFHRNIGKALCENLNRGVLAQSESKLTLIASREQAPEKIQTLQEAIEELDKEMKESVPFQFRRTEESFLPTKLKIVPSD